MINGPKADASVPCDTLKYCKLDAASRPTLLKECDEFFND